MKIYETNWQLLIAKFMSVFHQLPKHHIILLWLRVPSESKILKVLFYNFVLLYHRKSWSLFILLRNEGVVVGFQQMATTWVNQLSLLVQNDKNEILKPVKNNQKFFICINHYLFILISITQKYSIFWNRNLIRDKLKNILIETKYFIVRITYTISIEYRNLLLWKLSRICSVT